MLILFHNPAYAGIDLNASYLRLQNLIQKDPQNPQLKIQLAYLFTQGLEFGRAIQLYEDVLTKEPTNQIAVTELCVLNTQLRETKMAEKYCQKATELAPNSYLAFDNLGLSYFKLGEYQKSLKPFIKAVALKKDSVLVRVHLAQSFMVLREYQVARALLEQAELMPAPMPEKMLVYHCFFQLYNRLRDYDKALSAISKSYELSGNGLYLGKMVSAYAKANQFLVFLFVAAIMLWFCNYMGKRLNRFLKNE